MKRIRGSRIAEIESDIWEHRREAEEAGADPSDAGLQVLARCLAGMPSDLAWRSGPARRASAINRREPMNDVIRRSWWLLPAVLVGLFDVMLFIGQLTHGFGLMEFEPRVGTRLTAAAVWLTFSVCIAVGLALRNRRPQRAGILIDRWLAPRSAPRMDGRAAAGGNGRDRRCDLPHDHEPVSDAGSRVADDVSATRRGA